ncbi:RNA polymerase sigma factor [Chitinophaga sp. Ak27]|uniref:RNA polymerase sigma factor n=1 Tax=Chitinophaga sp. Ak27 TaxID=2726116 RepID=UPI00145D3922|nr:sigma-70 family RNA polymerase sigma factor [Chitinophaga sp. Ak27]NLU96292.1 sigma-70 family RNA polymerase sigma factor [Chitinophaga sp. Ak27]
MNLYITSNTHQNSYFFQLFQRGDETGLNYIYNNLYKGVFYYARRIIEDSFVINSILQEAFLRAWDFRTRMTSMLHLFRFIRLCVRWGCYEYLRKKVSKFHRGFMHLEFLENSHYASFNPEEEAECTHLSEKNLERLERIEKAIPYLPANRQTIIRLYMLYGLNYKEIARRFAAPYQHITTEIQESIESLKSMLLAPPQKQTTVRKNHQDNYTAHLTPDQAQIYKLRHQGKYSFDRISRETNRPLADVVNQYILANQTLQKIRKHGNKKNHSYA